MPAHKARKGPPRRVAPSEDEVDIHASLFADDLEPVEDGGGIVTDMADLDMGGILEGAGKEGAGGSDDDEDDDLATWSARLQNRERRKKAKGGGFQALGMFQNPVKETRCYN